MLFFCPLTGNYYWKLLENEIDEAYPRLISDDWDGLEGNLDAAFTFSSGETYFFKVEELNYAKEI